MSWNVRLPSAPKSPLTGLSSQFPFIDIGIFKLER
jgi:hypothetical protein